MSPKFKPSLNSKNKQLPEQQVDYGLPKQVKDKIGISIAVKRLDSDKSKLIVKDEKGKQISRFNGVDARVLAKQYEFWQNTKNKNKINGMSFRNSCFLRLFSKKQYFFNKSVDTLCMCVIIYM